MGQETEDKVVRGAAGQPEPANGAQQNQPGSGDTQPAGNTAPQVSRPQRISSPEQVDDYIRVTTPGMWLLALAILILLCAGIICAYALRIEVRTTNQNGEVTTEYVAPASYLPDGKAGN